MIPVVRLLVLPDGIERAVLYKLGTALVFLRMVVALGHQIKPYNERLFVLNNH